MSKLMFITGEDGRLLDILITALKEHGFSVEYSDFSEERPRSTVHTDIALVCKPESPQSEVAFGGISIDPDTMTAVTEEGIVLHFTPIEYTLLTYLLNNADRAVSRDELVPAVWGYQNHPGARMADDTIKRLRKKLVYTRLRLETVWGYGFKVSESERKTGSAS